MTSHHSRPKSAAASLSAGAKKPRDRGNLTKYLCLDEKHVEVKVAATPVGVNNPIIKPGAKKNELFADMNEISNDDNSKPAFLTEGIKLSKTAPVTKRFTTYFKGITTESGLGDEKIRSSNMNKKIIRQDCDDNFTDYWLSSNSVVKPHERIKVLTVKAEKMIEDDDVPNNDEGSIDDDEEVKPIVETRLERIRRLKKLQDLMPIDPIAVQLRAEELKLLADCKSQYRQSYNDNRRAIERGGTLEPVQVDDSSTVDVEALIGSIALKQPTTPGDELIAAAAASNTGPFFILEFMKPLIQAELGLEGGSFADITEIDLTSKMLGDDKILCVAEALKHTPNVKRLSLAGNGLTDKSITAVLEQSFDVLGCTFVDISDNKVDSGSIALLRMYLMKSGCKLEELVLSSSDIDDHECATLIGALSTNRSLVYLDLSHNTIGKKEEYNTVFPEFTTGGEAISEMLAENSYLQELNLSWNHICKDSALTLAKSIEFNYGLLSLNLSYNNIGDVAAQYLAHSLRYNHTLTKLDVSYNMIFPRGVMVFSHALAENTTLHEINLNGNSIGSLASRSLLRAVRHWAKRKRVITVHHRSGSMAYHDPTLFDRDNPSGDYRLDLSSPYEYAVACWLHEIGNAKPISKFKGIKHKPPDGPWVSIRLTRDVTIQSSNGPWDKQIFELNRALNLLVEMQSLQAKLQSLGQDFPSKNRAKLRLAIKDVYSNIKQIGNNLGLHFRNSFINVVKVALLKMAIEKRAQVHEVLKTIFQTAFRLVVRRETSPGDTGNWMYKEDLVRCFSLLGVGISRNELMKDADFDEENFMEHHEQAPTIHHGKQYQHVHSSNYEMVVAEFGEGMRKEEQDLVDKIHEVEELEVSGRDKLLMAERIIAGQNFDGSDVLDEANFVRMMFTNFTQTFPPKASPLIDMATNLPWELPKTGILVLTFVCDRMPPSTEELQSKESFAIFSEAIATSTAGKKDAKLEALKHAVVGDFYLTCEQAENLLDNFCDSQDAKMVAVSHFLPQMATTVDACRLLAQNLSVPEIFMLRVKLKNSFRVLTGNVGGHYYLDLSDPVDWHAGQKIAALNSLEKNKALVEVPTRDTSQTGNFENFRNATFNGRPITLTSTWFITCPQAGRLHFDYISTSRPVNGIKAMSSRSFNLLVQLLFATHSQHKRTGLKSMVSRLSQKARTSVVNGKSDEKNSPPRSPSKDATADDDCSNGSDDLSDDEDDDDDEMRSGKKEFFVNSLKSLRGGKTPVGRTLLQKLHLQMKRETQLEEEKKRGGRLSSGMKDSDSMSVGSGGKESAVRREAFSLRFQSAVTQSRKEQPSRAVQVFGSLSLPKSESTVISWIYQLDSTWEAMKFAYREYLLEKLKVAENYIKKDDPYNIMDPNFVTILAFKSNSFKNCRKLPIHAVVDRKLSSKNQLLQQQLYNNRKSVSAAIASSSTPANPALSAFVVTAPGTQVPLPHGPTNPCSAPSPEKKITALTQCLKFERELVVLEVYMVFGLWFTCQQVIVLMNVFLEHGAPEDVAVRVFCLLFHRIVDLDDIGRHLQALSPSLRFELCHRVGILNLWTSINPDCSVELDLASREGREAAKLILRLAAVEPGEHIYDEEYVASFLQPCKTGWHIPASWAENDNPKKAKGPPLMGFFRFSYTSDPEKAPGSVANWEARKEIMLYRLLAGTRGTFIRTLDDVIPQHVPLLKGATKKSEPIINDDEIVSSRDFALASTKLGPPLLSQLDEAGPSQMSSSAEIMLASGSTIEIQRSQSTTDVHRSSSKLEHDSFVFAADVEPVKEYNYYSAVATKQKYSIDTGVWTRAPGRL